MKVASSSVNVSSIYEHLSAEENRLELERTREELRNTKKQLAERDAEILQLKTAHRKLQDVLRKKDKDLQNVFSVLRAPQDAELTKKRRSELVERLLMETQQRVVNAEAVAEDRKRELDKLKFSSKFLRYQELDVEIEECYKEIERLRSQLSHYTIVGKLRVSTRSGPAPENAKAPSSTLRSKPSRREGNDNQSSERGVHFREQVVTPIVPRTALVSDTLSATATRGTKRENFVERTRRRAVEAEYQKQVRLAQLEAECELEENLRILAKREAAAQAELRRRTSQIHVRRTSHAAKVDTVGASVAAPVVGAAAENTAPVEDAWVPTDPEASTLLQSAGEAAQAGAESEVSAAETGQSEAIDLVVRELVAEVVAIADVGGSQDPPLVVENANEEQGTVDPNEPKQYDDDGFDEGADVDADTDEVPEPAERGTNNSNTTVTGGDGELADAVEDHSVVVVAAHEGESKISLEEALGEVEEEGQDEHKMEENGENDLNEEDDQHAPTSPPQQGFLVDPVSYVQLPASHSWQNNASDKMAEVPEEEETVSKPFEVDSARSVGTENSERGGSFPAPATSAAEADEFYEEVEEQEEQSGVELAKLGADAATEAKQEEKEDGIAEETPTAEDTTKSDKEEIHHHEIPQHHETNERKALREKNEQDEEEAEYDMPRSEEAVEELGETAVVESMLAKEQLQVAVECRSDKQRENVTAEAEEDPPHSPPSSEATSKAEQDAVEATPSPAVPTVEGPSTDTHSALPAEVVKEETVEQTLHACDDAIVAASTLIHRQIDEALAGSASSASRAGAIHAPTTNDATATPTRTDDLSAAELAIAMDAAARKIQKFWREMDAQYATPRSPKTRTSTTAEPAEPTEPVDVVGNDDEQQAAESPVVSDTDAAEEADGW